MVKARAVDPGDQVPVRMTEWGSLHVCLCEPTGVGITACEHCKDKISLRQLVENDIKTVIFYHDKRDEAIKPLQPDMLIDSPVNESMISVLKDTLADLLNNGKVSDDMIMRIRMAVNAADRAYLKKGGGSNVDTKAKQD